MLRVCKYVFMDAHSLLKQRSEELFGSGSEVVCLSALQFYEDRYEQMCAKAKYNLLGKLSLLLGIVALPSDYQQFKKQEKEAGIHFVKKCVETYGRSVLFLSFREKFSEVFLAQQHACVDGGEKPKDQRRKSERERETETS